MVYALYNDLVTMFDNLLILRATPAVALATGRATLAGQIEGDSPDERG